MKHKEEQDSFPPEEATKRFRAALLGARVAGHMPMKPPKIRKAAKKTKAKKKR